LDNFTHSLAGWALGQAGLKTKSRKGLAALILGANAPDIDVFLQRVPWEPLATHRGITHSLVAGVLVLPVLLWGLLLLLDRWQVSRGASFKSGLELHTGWLLALCFLGAVTHPLLDLQNTYSVQLLSPFSGGWFHTDGLFIIDAFIWGTVPLAIAWSRMREKQGRPWRGTVQVVLVTVLAYLALNIGLSDAAKALVQQRDPQASGTYASPPPVLFWKRRMIWRDGEGMIRQADFDPFDGPLGPTGAPLDDRMDDPVVRRAIAADGRLRKFLYWSTMPVAEVRRDGCTAHVTIGDARYGERAARARLSRETLVTLC
jgi:inner membrane protein